MFGTGNLDQCPLVPMKFGAFWKIIPLENNFEICFVGQYFWQLGETSEFRVVRNEPGANSTCFACKIDRDGLESSRKVGCLDGSRK